MRLAIPLFLAQFSQFSMSIVDTLMTGRYGALDMAAVALAGALWMPILLFGFGVLMAILPAISNLRGAQNHGPMGQIARNGFWMAMGLAVVLMSLVYFVSFRLEFFGTPSDLANLSGAYLRTLIFAGPGYLLFVVMRCTMEGLARVRPAMVAGFVGLGVNIPLNYLLIFGNHGFPALGAVGAGIATAFSSWSMFIIMLIFTAKMPDVRGFFALNLWRGPEWLPIKKLFSIGFPGALSLLCEVSLFAMAAMFIAPLGTIMVAGHQVALNFSGAMFMLPLSLGHVATIRTSYGLGQQDADAVRLSARVTLSVSFFLAAITAIMTLLFRVEIVSLYSQHPAIIELAAALLWYEALYRCADAVQIASVGILRGYNDTRALFGIIFVVYWLISMPLGFTLGRTDILVSAMGPAGFWLAFVIGITLAAIVLQWRVRVLEKKYLYCSGMGHST